MGQSGKYFTVEVKPFIKASHQAASSAAFAGDDVLFDWHAFQVPKGASKLLSINAVLRGADGASAGTLRDMDIYFAKTINGVAPATVGNANATMSAAPVVSNHIIGMAHIETSEYGNDAVDLFNIAQTGGGAGPNIIPSVVLEGEPDSGDNVGFDKLYMAGSIGGAFSFGTTVIARGVVKEIQAFSTNAQPLLFDATSGITDTIADNEEIFNVFPIKFVLSFER